MSTYIVPQKRITSPASLEALKGSETWKRLLRFTKRLNESVVSVKLSDPVHESPAVKAIMGVLDRVREVARAIPPVETPSRFGNPAFRDFYDRVQQSSSEWHKTIPGVPEDAIPELSAYLTESWGNRQRIDYGSGMELNFLSWLLCLELLGVFDVPDGDLNVTEGDQTPNEDPGIPDRKGPSIDFKASDYPAIVTRIFWSYIDIMRVLQTSYWLEPAGSHGAWGLDDYHHLPFLFGSAQLRKNKFPGPGSIKVNEIVEQMAKEYMYFACIQFNNSIKTVSFGWHSPMQWDISKVKKWTKVNEGMFKMYLGEVLGKLPVMQHFLFGSLLPAPPLPADADTGTNGHDHDHENEMIEYDERGVPKLGAHGHGHAHEGLPDCCGIPVPSAFGAAKAEQRVKKGLQGPGIWAVPFD